jgi:uncharacterized protein YjbI with pentapeptide repeats
MRKIYIRGNMPSSNDLRILKQGVEKWNSWRYRNQHISPDLSGIDFSDKYLKSINLQKVNLRGANLSKAILIEADLREANLQDANLQGISLENAKLDKANLQGADLSEALLMGAHLQGANLADATLYKTFVYRANLSDANLIRSTLNHADFSHSDLGKANLSNVHAEEADFSDCDLSWAICKNGNFHRARFIGAKLHWAEFNNAILTDTTLVSSLIVETNLENVDLTGAWIYGASVWNPNLTGAIQRDLTITSSHTDSNMITVDNLEIAQFIYLLLRTAKIRDVISTIGRKAVLILGRFTLPERKEILDTIRDLLRKKDYLPIVFEFEKSDERDFTETIKVLAGMCLFVVADITNPKSSPLELQATVPDFMIPFAPIIQSGEQPFSMFKDLQHKYRGVLDVRTYNDKEHLLTNFENGIINPALAKHGELLLLKNEALKIRPIDGN